MQILLFHIFAVMDVEFGKHASGLDVVAEKLNIVC
jgi:hypothetical protein